MQIREGIELANISRPGNRPGDNQDYFGYCEPANDQQFASDRAVWNRLDIPADASGGQYTARVELQDQLTGLSSNESAPFNLAGGGGLSRPPIAVFQPPPPYTEEARKARIQGVVVIRCLVRKDGSVGNFAVVRGFGHGLDESAINTIATSWRFRPGTLNGTPVDGQATVQVRFGLD